MSLARYLSKLGALLNSDGKVPTAALGAGAVLQVVTQVYATSQSTTSGTQQATGLTLAITPTSTSSKILIFASFGDVASNASANGMKIYLSRNGSAITQVHNNLEYGTMAGAGYVIGGTAFTYADSPSATSATTYSFTFSSQNGANAVTVFRDNTSGSLILMEIAV